MICVGGAVMGEAGARGNERDARGRPRAIRTGGGLRWRRLVLGFWSAPRLAAAMARRSRILRAHADPKHRLK